MANDEFIEPSRKAQLTVAVVIILSVLAYVMLEDTFSGVLPTESASPAEWQQAGEKLQLLGWASTILVAGWLGFLSIYCLRLGLRTLGSGQFPPPNTTVLRRMRVTRDRFAALEGWACFLLTGIFLSFGGIVIYLQILSVGAL